MYMDKVSNGSHPQQDSNLLVTKLGPLCFSIQPRGRGYCFSTPDRIRTYQLRRQKLRAFPFSLRGETGAMVINPLFLPCKVRPDCSQFCRCLFVHVYTMIFKPNHWLVGSPIQLGLHFGRNINASNLLIVDRNPTTLLITQILLLRFVSLVE